MTLQQQARRIVAKEKFEVNKARRWGKPDAEGVVEHIG